MSQFPLNKFRVIIYLNPYGGGISDRLLWDLRLSEDVAVDYVLNFVRYSVICPCSP